MELLLQYKYVPALGISLGISINILSSRFQNIVLCMVAFFSTVIGGFLTLNHFKQSLFPYNFPLVNIIASLIGLLSLIIPRIVLAAIMGLFGMLLFTQVMPQNEFLGAVFLFLIGLLHSMAAYWGFRHLIVIGSSILGTCITAISLNQLLIGVIQDELAKSIVLSTGPCLFCFGLFFQYYILPAKPKKGLLAEEESISTETLDSPIMTSMITYADLNKKSIV